MAPRINLPTLGNKEICIEFEDAAYIGFESETVAAILTGRLKEEDYNDQRFGGKAINFAMEYCKKFGKIKSSCPPWLEFKPDANAIGNLEHYYSLKSSPEFEMECKKADVEAWVNDFISQIIENGIGMVHELIAASNFLFAFRLSDLVCQYIFDYLTLEHYGKFRKTFGFSFLYAPFGSNKETWFIDHVLEDILQLPTSKDIHDKFHAEFPFTSHELNLAELENRSMRVDGDLEYKNEERLVKNFFIKTEYLVRRLSSLQRLSFWMEDALSERFTEFISLLQKFFDNESNNDIKKFRLMFSDHALKFRQNILCLKESAAAEFANPCTSYEDTDLIRDGINKIELKLAADANKQKAEIDKLARNWQKEWQAANPHRKDKVLPHLIFFLEDRYHEIHRLLCNLRGWTSPEEVKKWNVCNNPVDQNEDQYEDVENEEPNEDHYMNVGSEEQNEDLCDGVKSEEQNEDICDDVESEEQKEDICDDDVESEDLVRPKSITDDKIRDDIFSSLMTLQDLVECTSRNFCRTHRCFLTLEIKTRQLLHVDLLLKDEKILTFICKKKLKLYKSASKQRTSTINFPKNKHEARCR